MDNKIDNIDFINSVEKILEEFLTTQIDKADPLFNVYVVFDYEDVEKSYKKMDEGELNRKPVIQITDNNLYNNKITYGSTEGDKAEKNYFNYSVFSVIDNNIEPTIKRKTLLNKISSKIKNKFDNYKYLLDEFNNVNINYSEGNLGKNADDLYASQQTLTFNVIKTV